MTRSADVPPAALEPRDDGERELVGMARGSALNLAGALFSQLSLLAISLVLAHRLGAADLGVYWQSFALLSLLELMALGGFGLAATRFVALHRAERDAASVRGTIRLTVGVSTALALLLGVVLFAAAPWLSRDVFHDERLLVALRFVAFTLPAISFQDVALAATRGFRSMRQYAVVGLMIEPALRVTLTTLLVIAGFGLVGAMASLAISNLVAAILAGTALRRLLGPRQVRPSYHPREMLRFSFVSWVAALATTGLIWADTILIGIYLSSSDVGLYSVATRVVVLASFVQLPINTAFAPRIADLYHRNETEILGRTYAFATTWIVRLSIPAFVVLVLFPKQILAIFGPAFPVAAAVTVVLALGKAIDAATGPCAMMLNMSGRPVWNMADNLCALALNVGLNLLLIPRYGIFGSAVAWAVVLVVVNGARLIQVRWTMGMWPFAREMAPTLVAAAAAAAAGAVVGALLSGPSELVVGVAAVLATYLSIMIAVGLSSEDRELLLDVGRSARLSRLVSN